MTTTPAPAAPATEHPTGWTLAVLATVPTPAAREAVARRVATVDGQPVGPDPRRVRTPAV